MKITAYAEGEFCLPTTSPLKVSITLEDEVGVGHPDDVHGAANEMQEQAENAVAVRIRKMWEDVPQKEVDRAFSDYTRYSPEEFLSMLCKWQGGGKAW